MTIRDEILQILTIENRPMADSELAEMMLRPTPSVRRTRNQLELDGLVTWVDNKGPRQALRVRLA